MSMGVSIARSTCAQPCRHTRTSPTAVGQPSTTSTVRARNTAPARPTAAVRASKGTWDAQQLFYGDDRVPSATSAFGLPLPAPEGTVKQFDFIVIGSGIAGLTYAIKVAQYGSVAVITKDYAKEGCTQYAQGGVCAVLDATDSVQDHVRDTIVAGAFLNDNKCVVEAGTGAQALLFRQKNQCPTCWQKKERSTHSS